MSRYLLSLSGALRLQSPEGTDCTPKLAKTQGLLAILAIAEGKPIHRAKLQDLLWSDRGPKQGRDSLRGALSELKRCFQPFCPIETSGGPVRLNLDNISVDIFEDQESESTFYRPEFLEGIDIADPEFNEWLREVRASMRRACPRRVGAPAKPPEKATLESVPLIEVGIMPNASGSYSPLQEAFVSRLGQQILQSGIMRTVDLRAQREVDDHARNLDVLLYCDHAIIGDEHLFSVDFQVFSSRATLLSASIVSGEKDLSSAFLFEKAAEIFDQFCDRLAKSADLNAPEHFAAKRLFYAIDRLFKLTNFDLDEAGAALDEACSISGAGTIYAWNAFLSAFRLEKLGSQSYSEIRDIAEEHAQKALELDPHNPLCAALVGHVYGFVLKDRDRAAELLHCFVDQADRHPMLADTIAMNCYYRGDFQASREYAEKAVRLGRFNPFRYSFTTSLAMSNLMCGDLKPAIANCSMALAQHPVRGGFLYEPMLRALAAAAGHNDQKKIGLQAFRLLEEQKGQVNLSPEMFPNAETLRVYSEGMGKLHV